MRPCLHVVVFTLVVSLLSATWASGDSPSASDLSFTASVTASDCGVVGNEFTYGWSSSADSTVQFPADCANKYVTYSFTLVSEKKITLRMLAKEMFSLYLPISLP
jgi:hypothetical protein